MAPPKKGDLSPEEKALLEAVGKGNTEEAARLLGNKNVHINCLDDHGMTPLMHAAYKGKVDVCKLLLRHGADVNCNEHEHGYTALMFAGLSGNKEITWMMLEAGADTDAVNSVGRTAAQMAAFVEKHDCVAVINNFFPRERLVETPRSTTVPIKCP